MVLSLVLKHSSFEHLKTWTWHWILSEDFFEYGSYDVYLQKCRQVRILPLKKRLDYNDLVLLYKVIHNLIPLKLPFYLTFYEGNSRLRTCHLDHLSLVSTINPKTNVISDTNKNSALYKSFYYRVHLQWNLLPIEIRSIQTLPNFKSEIIKYLWKSILTDIDDTEYLEEDLHDAFQ